MMVHLCERLRAVLRLVPPGVPVADIGCDHGQLSCALLERGTPWVAAVDISAPSLEKARRLAARLALEDRLCPRVGDGLADLEPEIGAVVIAGLSAHTIGAILRAHPEAAHRVDCLVLQPMQDMEGLRRTLVEEGFRIQAEDMVFENRRYYPLLRAVPGEAYYSEEELELGPCLLAAHHPLLPRYLLWRMGVIQRAARNLTGPERLEMDKEIVRLERIRQIQSQSGPVCS